MIPFPHPLRAIRADLRPVLRAAASAVLAAALLPSSAAAELPDTATLLSSLGLSADEIAKIESGEIVQHSVPSSSERELTTGLAFQVPIPPGELVKSTSRDLLDAVDPNSQGFGVVSTPAQAGDFAKLSLTSDQAKVWLGAEAGSDLNLSKAEIAALQKLGSNAATGAVEESVRAALLARAQAYQSRGLSGIAPYERGSGEQRSPADELRSATKGAKQLAKYAPQAHALLGSYPAGKPAGTQEIYRWSQFEAHGVPTLALSHVLLVPDGDAWILSKRQFYVSTGYNTEEAVAAFLPSEAGTVVVYATRTSTDQVTGFGGGAKRSIGSKLLASQLTSLFEKARAKAQ